MFAICGIITEESLRQFHKKSHREENMVIYVRGKFGRKKAHFRVIKINWNPSTEAWLETVCRKHLGKWLFIKFLP